MGECLTSYVPSDKTRQKASYSARLLEPDRRRMVSVGRSKVACCNGKKPDVYCEENSDID